MSELDEFDVVTACIVGGVVAAAYYVGGIPLAMCAVIGVGLGYLARRFVVRKKKGSPETAR